MPETRGLPEFPPAAGVAGAGGAGGISGFGGTEEEQLEIASREGMKAKVTDVVKKDPRRAATILNEWLSE